MKKIAITGFDCDGEPEVRMEDDGSVVIVFEFMPPINGTDDGVEDEDFDHFDQVLQEALGVEVVWDDREVFVIPNPEKDTVQKIKHFLEHYWDRKTVRESRQEINTAPTDVKEQVVPWWKRWLRTFLDI